MDVDITTALIAAIVTAAGWLVAHLLEQRSERIRRSAEATAVYANRQLEEFYGPLFNLINQVFVVWEIHEKILGSNRKPPVQWSDDDRHRIEMFFYTNYFFPLHDEIRAILKTRLHLIHGSDLPEGVESYLRHSLQQQAQVALSRDLMIDTSHVKGEPFPPQFHQEIVDGMRRSMVSFEWATRSLESSRQRSWF